MTAITINHNTFNIKALIFLAMCFICSGSLYAQTYFIDGHLNPTIGQSEPYAFIDSNYSTPGSGFYYMWYANSGGVITESNSSTYFDYNAPNINITWTSLGTKTLMVDVYDDYSDYYDEITVTVSASAPPPPTTPTIQSTNCGNTVLQRGTPPSGVTWYWQSSAGGTSTSNSASTITLTSGSIYYLRARNSSNVWSTTSRSVSYSINTVPATPAIPTVTNNCNSTILTRSTPPSGVTYYWQSSSSGTSTSNSSTTITRISGTVYYLRPKNNNSSCWGTARSVNYSVNKAPLIPVKPTVTNNCGSTVLTRSTPPSGVTYYWQSSSSGTSTSNSSTTVTRTSGTIYYIRARNNSNLCWSIVRSVSYSVNEIPSIPATPTVTNNCGSTVLTRSTPPSGITYYWQSSSNGTSTSSSSTSITRTSGTVYYLRARNNSNGCWSTARSVSYLVNVVPGIPATPTVTNNCGNTVLTRSTPPSGITYYWQSSSSGTSTSSSSTSITRTNGTVYYLRARNNSNGCWSTARSVSYLVNVVPSTPSTPTVTNNCGSTVLTRSTPPSGITYYWQSSTNGTSTSSSSTSITRTSGTVYYLRARNNSNGCWSIARSVSYLVNVVPGIPATPTVTNNCGSTVLTRSTSPSGITYYWQSSSSGTSTSSSSTSITRTSGTVYYLRARNNSSGCWSTASTVSYTISQSTTWYADADGDGYGSSGVSIGACIQPNNYVANNLDYDDNTVNITNIAPQTFYADIDDDGFGDATVSVFYSVMPAGYVTNNADQCPTEYGTYNGCDYTPAVLSDENYIYTRTYQKPMSSDSEINQDTDIIESVAYFDGLGRPMQSVGIKAAPDKKDIVTHIGYDTYGRQDKDWLPYHETTGNLGSYRSGSEASTHSFYDVPEYEDTTNPYSEKHFEASPLSRILEQGAPGNDWLVNKTSDTDNTIKFEYQTNILNEVKHYSVTTTFADNTFTPALIDHGNYVVGKLYKSITKDENWTSGTNHTIEEFKDKQGRVILKRTYADVNGISTPHDTYYVYDDFGNLTYVLPPNIDTSVSITSTILDNLGYQYIYDHRNRLVEKKIPGKGWEYIVYNKLNQPILTQDANLEEDDKWLFTKYDAFGRVAYTGMYSDGSFRTDLQDLADANSSQYVTKSSSYTTIAGTIIYYDNGGYPTVAATDELHTINYYDDYTFDIESGVSETSYGIAPITNTKGLATGSKVRVLDSSPVKWITTVTYYDEKSRPIYVYSFNDYLGTTDKVKSQLDFTGQITETNTVHDKTGQSTITTVDTFAYDHAGRLISQKQKINNLTEELIVLNTYDELGQLENKKVGGAVAGNIENSTGLQMINYTYNIRGWLKQINDPSSLGADLFGFKINYNTNDYGATNLFNGNISATEWRTANTDNSLKWYNYSYDELNRITGATNTSNTNYNISNIAYDKNGNILNLQRQGHTNAGATLFGTMDNLSYTYETNSNKLLEVADTGNDAYGFKDGTNSNNDYTYDDNGNMIMDLNKGITNITYNHLNLPTLVDINDGGSNIGTISYLYDATGVKLEKTVSTGVTTEYAGNHVYEDGSLKFFNHPEGYVEPNGSSFDYIYQYRDHLGNIRLSYNDSNDDGIITGGSTQIFFDGFESVSGWDGTGHTWGWEVDEFDSNFKFQGNYTARLDPHPSIYWANAVHSNEWIDISNTETTDYIYSAWVYMENITENKARIFLFMNEDGETGYYTLLDQHDPTVKGKWCYVEKRVSVPANITKLNLRIDNYYAGSVWYDDVSIRKVNDPATVEILEENNYYPFGLKHKGYNLNVASTNIALKRKFGGKEYQDELGLGWYDITARNYDPELGRWMNLDPLAEKMRRHSPYNYAFDNPIFFIDPDGMMPFGPGDRTNVNVISEKGKVLSPERRNGARMRTSSFKNNRASSVTTYNVNDSNLSSGMQKIQKAVGVKENFVSVSREQMTQVGQFFDKNGNKVSAKDNKTGSFVLTTTTVNQSIDLTGDISLDSEVTTTTTTTTQTFSVYRGGGFSEENPNGSIHSIFEEDSTTVSSSETQTLNESGNDFFEVVKSSLEQNASNQRSNRDKLAKQTKKLSKMAEDIGKNLGDAAQN
ncbi:DUF6443 domain-containing protein [Flavivirga jejuensis]|uniref:DUF6443 domain-containing protein n=1 Tax=Flavivirga jejuensis TaxID=870487 RepID=A0ABT8WT02_9FLAO|nr:DUF6443 domain-containing protein [Flavivirga jejuensis]MDO5976001.1 DUF6443 domain-containing protein [Flavivirga jejuensis]